jgi:hypothetical protein
MRPRQALIGVVVVALTALQGAAASETSRASFLAFLSGTVTKQWTYSTSPTVNGCTVKTNGAGTRKISIRSSDNSVVAASWSGRGRVRFSSGVRFLGGAVQQSGTKTTRGVGPSTCDKSIHRLTCTPLTHSFQNQAAQPVSRRAHRFSFLAMKALVPANFFNSCPGEPTAVRSIGGGLELAGSNLSEADLFDRAVAGITLQGSSDVTTQTVSGSAKVVQHISWRLTLRRLGS